MYLSSVLPWKSAKWEAPSLEEMDRIRREAGTHEAALAEEGDLQAQTNGETNGGNKDSLESGDSNGEK
jgi:hypothetical protein